MTVLVTAGDSIKALVVTRSLGQKGIKVYTAEEYSPYLSSFSRYSKKSFKYPSPRRNPGSFISWLINILKKEDIRTVIPTHSRDTYVISMYKKEIEEETAVPIPVPEYSALKLANDKGTLIKFAKKLGIPVPKTYHIKSLEELKDIADSIMYPAVIKVRESSSSLGVEYAYSPQELTQTYNKIVRAYKLPPEKYPIIQEYIQGGGYGVSLLFNNGKLKAKFTHKRIREYPITGGPSTCRTSIRFPRMERYAIKLLKHLKWHGVAMVEFKVESITGTPFLLEVNPRFWGSLYQAIESGVDFPYLLYKMAVEGDVDSTFSYKTGVITRNYFIDLVAIINYIRRKKSKNIINDMFKWYPDDILKLSDPLPTLGFIYSAAKQISHNQTNQRGSI